MTGYRPHWADLLSLREEVVGSGGSVGELQMSLHKAVYQTVDVPYRKVEYYADITEPTPNLLAFFGRVARRLGTTRSDDALFHLHQGMGGGKSHALVGLFHLANDPKAFFGTTLGEQVLREAEMQGDPVTIDDARVVALTADYFSPGKTNEIFGPAKTLFERFIWSLVDRDMDDYKRYVAMGPDKATIQTALKAVGKPVLILLDELMDYVQALSDATALATMPGERAFLNALCDACDDVDRVAFVIVMIRSDLDEAGYSVEADDFRRYITARLEKHPGGSVAVTESADFAGILRRRLFESTQTAPQGAGIASAYAKTVDGAWEKQLEALGSTRGLDGLADRIDLAYPFHPELMRLVREEWSSMQGFQRVRSTVAIFARTALHWSREHLAGRWSPTLIGVGDLHLPIALESVLSSGLLFGNDRAVQGFRAVAQNDITTTDGTGGRAVMIDRDLIEAGVALGQPSPAVRMATAAFCYSIVPRSQGRRGAIKAELLTAVLEPTGTSFGSADEVFNALTAEEGLGALEVTTPPNAPARYTLSIKQTLKMFFTASKGQASPEEAAELVWNVAKSLAVKGSFEELKPVDRGDAKWPLTQVFGEVDSQATRLVLLDPRRWTLLNGRDNISRQEIQGLLGTGTDALRLDNAASCVVVCVNTQRRDNANRRALEVLAWRSVIKQLTDDSDDELREAKSKLAEIEAKLKADVLRAFQHYVFLLRTDAGLIAEFRRFDEEGRSALNGSHVWTELISTGRAVAGRLGAAYLAELLDGFGRDLTPKEIFQAFYKNPSFPLLSSLDEARQAVFALLQAGWELVDSEGTVLHLDGPGNLQISSMAQTLRRSVPVAPTPPPTATTPSAATHSATANLQPPLDEAPAATDPGGQATALDATPKSTTTAPPTFKRYKLQVDNRSLTTSEGRQTVWQLIQELAQLLDPAYMDRPHQLFSMTAELVTAEGEQGHLQQRTDQLQGRFQELDEDF